MLLKAQVCLTATAGVCSHPLIFIRGERHVQALTLLRIYLVLSFYTFNDPPLGDQ